MPLFEAESVVTLLLELGFLRTKSNATQTWECLGVTWAGLRNADFLPCPFKVIDSVVWNKSEEIALLVACPLDFDMIILALGNNS